MCRAAHYEGFGGIMGIDFIDKLSTTTVGEQGSLECEIAKLDDAADEPAATETDSNAAAGLAVSRRHSDDWPESIPKFASVPAPLRAVDSRSPPCGSNCDSNFPARPSARSINSAAWLWTEHGRWEMQINRWSSTVRLRHREQFLGASHGHDRSAGLLSDVFGRQNYGEV
jgi:hypothetical protein